MTTPEPLRLTLAEQTAQRITHEWMRHLGYTNERIEIAEAQTCENSGCEFVAGLGWDCSDEHGRSNHPERDDLVDAAELVMFVLERLPVVERDEAAELREAALRACEALMACRYSLDRNNKSGWFDIEVRVADDSIAALRRLVGMEEG